MLKDAIDAFIAPSVFYIAFVNMNGFQKYFDREPPNLMVMVVSIGLVHGIGLSTRLQQLPLDRDNLLMQIISFNVGVEIGQILALSIMLIIIGDNKQNVFCRLSNVFVGASGILLFLGQMHGYLHDTNPDEFGFSDDLHSHSHMKMKPAGMPELNMDNISMEDIMKENSHGDMHSHDGGPAHSHQSFKR